MKLSLALGVLGAVVALNMYTYTLYVAATKLADDRMSVELRLTRITERALGASECRPEGGTVRFVDGTVIECRPTVGQAL